MDDNMKDIMTDELAKSQGAPNPVKEFDMAWRFIHKESGVCCSLNLSSRPDQPPFHWFFYLLPNELWWMPIRKASPAEVAQVGKAVTEQDGNDTPTVSIPTLTFFREEFATGACIGAAGMAFKPSDVPSLFSPSEPFFLPTGDDERACGDQIKEREGAVTFLSEIRKKREMEEEQRALRRSDDVYAQMKSCDSDDFAELLDEAFFSLELKIFLKTLVDGDPDQSVEGCRAFARGAIMNIRKAISENPALAKNSGKQYTLVSTYLLR